MTMPTVSDIEPPSRQSKARAALEFARHAERLGQHAGSPENEATCATQAVEARFITGQDAVIQTADGGRLPTAPFEDALKLNQLRDAVEERDPSQSAPVPVQSRTGTDGAVPGAHPNADIFRNQGPTDVPLESALPPFRTNPLFPPATNVRSPFSPTQVTCWLIQDLVLCPFFVFPACHSVGRGLHQHTFSDSFSLGAGKTSEPRQK